MQHVWGTSWGVSTRLIGGVIMTHGDDSGLILPPRVAPFQVVIVPIGRDNWRETVLPRAQEIQGELVAAGIRVTLDERDERPGWKFSEWELRGVPLRLEIGPKDIEKSQVLIARRDTREKIGVPMEGMAGRIRELLDAIQKNLFERAVAFHDEHTQRVATYDAFKAAMEKRRASSSRRGAARPTARRRSRPTRRPRSGTCRSAARRRRETASAAIGRRRPRRGSPAY